MATWTEHQTDTIHQLMRYLRKDLSNLEEQISKEDTVNIGKTLSVIRTHTGAIAEYTLCGSRQEIPKCKDCIYKEMVSDVRHYLVTLALPADLSKGRCKMLDRIDNIEYDKR